MTYVIIASVTVYSVYCDRTVHSVFSPPVSSVPIRPLTDGSELARRAVSMSDTVHSIALSSTRPTRHGESVSSFRLPHKHKRARTAREITCPPPPPPPLLCLLARARSLSKLAKVAR